MSEEATWRSRLAGPGLAVLTVACCMAGPVLVGAAGALTLGAWLGVAAGALALLALCLFVARGLRSGRAC